MEFINIEVTYCYFVTKIFQRGYFMMLNHLPSVNFKTTLVLLPGLDGTEIFFGPLLRHLPSWVDPVVIVYPTSGSNDYLDLLPIVMSEVATLKSFVILGWSFGGPLALMVASRCPSQVSGVILCGSFVTPPRPRLVPFRSAVTAPCRNTSSASAATRTRSTPAHSPEKSTSPC